MEDSAKIVRIHQGLYAEQVLKPILAKLKDALGCEDGSDDYLVVHTTATSQKGY